MKLLFQIPSEYLDADSTIRIQRVYVEYEPNLPLEIIQFLYAKLEAKALTDTSLCFDPVRVKVAIYQQQPHQQGFKYIEYDYAGDNYK